MDQTKIKPNMQAKHYVIQTLVDNATNDVINNVLTSVDNKEWCQLHSNIYEVATVFQEVSILLPTHFNRMYFPYLEASRLSVVN